MTEPKPPETQPELWCAVHGSRQILRIGHAARFIWVRDGLSIGLRCGCTWFLNEEDADFQYLAQDGNLPYDQYPVLLARRARRSSGWFYYPKPPPGALEHRKGAGKSDRVRRVYAGRDFSDPVPNR